jgi:hypothetical protein
MRLLIAGSRDISDYNVLQEHINHVLKDIPRPVTEVISGTARGVDRLGEQWATNFNIPIRKMPADWDKYQKAAGMIRNRDMAELCDCAVIVWDGKSRGTMGMISELKRLGKPYYLVIMEGDS